MKQQPVIENIAVVPHLIGTQNRISPAVYFIAIRFVNVQVGFGILPESQHVINNGTGYPSPVTKESLMSSPVAVEIPSTFNELSISVKHNQPANDYVTVQYFLHYKGRWIMIAQKPSRIREFSVEL